MTAVERGTMNPKRLPLRKRRQFAAMCAATRRIQPERPVAINAGATATRECSVPITDLNAATCAAARLSFVSIGGE